MDANLAQPCSRPSAALLMRPELDAVPRASRDLHLSRWYRSFTARAKDPGQARNRQPGFRHHPCGLSGNAWVKVVRFSLPAVSRATSGEHPPGVSLTSKPLNRVPGIWRAFASNVRGLYLFAMRRDRTQLGQISIKPRRDPLVRPSAASSTDSVSGVAPEGFSASIPA